MGLKPRKAPTYGVVSVSLTSVAESLPTGQAMPPLLKAFSEWVSTQAHGALGYFDGVFGDTFSDGGLSDDANQQIDAATGPFIALGEGSRVALWAHDDGEPAVVRIDSEGQHETLAANLEAFLLAWGQRKCDVGDLDDLYSDKDEDDPPSAHGDLAAWLEARGVRAKKQPPAPDFAAWVASFPVLDAAQAPQEGYPTPPSDLCKRLADCLGLLTDEAPLDGLLTDLGVDVSTLKTADDYRFFAVPEHGFALRFERAIDQFGAWPSPHGPYNVGDKANLAKKSRMLVSAEFCAAGYESFDRQHGARTFKQFAGELPFGVTFADKEASLKTKPGLELVYETYFRNQTTFIKTMVSLVDPDEEDSAIPAGHIETVSISLGEQS